MTETRTVSIEEVRALVAERQRYEDWLTALEAKRAETPVRVFERVHGDYVARRSGVIDRLREHVDGLATMAHDLDTRVQALEAQLNTLEDERAEAMLRTAVGEFDSDRWERVRQDVEAQIGQLGEQRTGLLTEVDEVRVLLASARSEPEIAADITAEIPVTATVDAPEAVDAVTANRAEVAHDGMGDIVADTDVREAPVSSPPGDRDAESPIDRVSTDEAFGGVKPCRAEPLVDGLVSEDGATADDELAELDNALSLFGGSPNGSQNAAPGDASNGGGSPSLNDLDVFDDAELGDLRMVPPVRSTATATPPASPNSAATAGAATGAPATSRDGFDDLAFLRSVVDPSQSTGAAPVSASGDQTKTLRCTECGTMNFPTEWYCERCGGELAAF